MSINLLILGRQGQEGTDTVRTKSIIKFLGVMPIMLGVIATPGRAQEHVCQGVDLMERYRVEDPARFQRIRDHFATIENGDGVFWKVEKPNLPASYLFGTAHLTDKRVMGWLPRIRPALEASRLLFVELADLNNSALGSPELLRRYGMLPGGETLDRRLAEDDQKLLGRLSASHGMPWFSARRLKPAMLAILLGIPPCAKVPILRGEKVLDAQIIEAAQNKDIPVIGLETLELQLSMINELDQDRMLAGLIETARAGNRFAENIYETTVRTQQTGEIALILSLMHEMREEFPDNTASMETIKNVLLDTRNIGMHERALSEMERGGVFLAVGALHLPGDKGLVKLFQDSGFTVTPLNPDR